MGWIAPKVLHFIFFNLCLISWCSEWCWAIGEDNTKVGSSRCLLSGSSKFCWCIILQHHGLKAQGRSSICMISASGSDWEAVWILSWKRESLPSWDFRQANRTVQAPEVSDIMYTHSMPKMRLFRKMERNKDTYLKQLLVNEYVFVIIQVENQIFLLVLYLNWMNPNLF